MICSQCMTENREDNNFCSNCGYLIKRETIFIQLLFGLLVPFLPLLFNGYFFSGAISAVVFFYFIFNLYFNFSQAFLIVYLIFVLLANFSNYKRIVSPKYITGGKIIWTICLQLFIIYIII